MSAIVVNRHPGQLPTQNGQQRQPSPPVFAPQPVRPNTFAEQQLQPITSSSAIAKPTLSSSPIRRPPSRTEKKFKCTFDGCDKAYYKPSRLAEHELTHTGEVG
jgi:hypothetical protein